MTAFIIVVMIGFALLLYFTPSYVACKQLNRNYVAIFWLNLFLGWTFVGWVICLVWATMKPAQIEVRYAE